MKEYQKVVASLGLDPTFNRFLTGDLNFPLTGAESPPYWYGFPPALIPLSSIAGRPRYLGLWKHWFIERELTYAEMFVAAGRLTCEIARTADQFINYVAISAIVEQDEITPEIEQFADQTGLRDLTALDELTVKSGDNPSGFIYLPEFQNRTPLGSVPVGGNYDGNFPYVTSTGSIANGLYSCEFEIDAQMLANQPRGNSGVRWLDDKRSRQEWFESSLHAGDLGDAWIALNCKGWTIANARRSIVDLAAAAKDVNFDALTSAWLSVADVATGGY